MTNCSFFSSEKIYGANEDITALRSSGAFSVCLVVSGSGIHQVLDREIPCSKGDICIIPPGVPHDYFLLEPEGNLAIRSLSFDISEWFDGHVADRNSKEYCYGIFNDNSIIAYATLNSIVFDRIYLLYDYIECELLEKKRGWRDLIRGYITDLFISVSRYMDSAIKNTANVSAKDWNVASASITAVQEMYGDSDLTLRRIAEALYISQSQLCRIFKKTTGLSFSQYLRSVRIRHVCQRLKKSGTNVESIARECGFRDMNTFYEAFASIVGMTPKKYRQSMAETEITNNKTVNKEKIMAILSDISENLQKGKAKIVTELVKQAIDEGSNPEQILNEGLLHGMNIIGEKFKNNEVYVPEVLVAARAMNKGTEVLKPYLSTGELGGSGRVCIGTVKGDLHDIGKNLVKLMMEGKGLEVIDLGTDVSPETFVQTAIEKECQVICCSALLTTTMDEMEQVVKCAIEAGIRDKVKIMVGGAPVSEDFCKQIGADCYTVDAASAADAAVELCKN